MPSKTLDTEESKSLQIHAIAQASDAGLAGNLQRDLRKSAISASPPKSTGFSNRVSSPICSLTMALLPCVPPGSFDPLTRRGVLWILHQSRSPLLPPLPDPVGSRELAPYRSLRPSLLAPPGLLNHRSMPAPSCLGASVRVFSLAIAVLVQLHTIDALEARFPFEPFPGRCPPSVPG